MNSSMGADDLGVGVGYPSMVTGDPGTDMSLGFGLKGHGPSLCGLGLSRRGTELALVTGAWEQGIKAQVLWS